MPSHSRDLAKALFFKQKAQPRKRDTIKGTNCIRPSCGKPMIRARLGSERVADYCEPCRLAILQPE